MRSYTAMTYCTDNEDKLSFRNDNKDNKIQYNTIEEYCNGLLVRSTEIQTLLK